MRNSTVVGIAIITLIVGGLVGFVVGTNYSINDNTYRGQMQANRPNGGAGMSGMAMHKMPNGQMMQNDAMGGMSMAEMMTQMNAELSGKTGDEFDKAFLREMIVHHQGAVEMAKLALQSANHQEIKTLASAIITAQNKEIADMKTWLRVWYGLTGPANR